MAETNIGPQKTFHLSTNMLLLLIVVVVILAFLGGWYSGNRHNKPEGQAAIASGMLLYRNSQYGLELMYPSDWNSPVVSVVPGTVGKHYLLNFNNSGSKTVSVAMDTQNATTKVCDTNNNCSQTTAITKATLGALLKTPQSVWTTHNSDSYSVVTSLPAQNIATLNVYKIVNLTKINVSAVHATYTVQGDVKNCPKNKFASTGDNQCVTKDNYDSVVQVIDSIKTI